MKRKGFTLIELLAVIVMLAIIALIAVPVIMNIISSARESAFEDTAYGLISAGEMYYASALLKNGMTSDVEFTITDGKFVGENKLEVKGALPTNGKIKVARDGKVAIAINDGFMCAKKRMDNTKITSERTLEYCTLEATLKELARTNDVVTSINVCVSDGTECAIGTPFAIEVAPGNIQNFYVVSDKNNKVTLIMDRNIGNTVAWTNQEDYIAAGGTSSEYGSYGRVNKGPLTALNYLESQTSNWTNITAKTYTLQDEQGRYKIQRIGARTRMLNYSEANSIISGDIGPTPGSCYWVNDTFSAVAAFRVASTVVSGLNVNYGHVCGVCPVIEISK